MAELADATDQELAEEVERRGLLPQCPCSHWSAFLWPADGIAVTLCCRGCLMPVNRCPCAI